MNKANEGPANPIKPNQDMEPVVAAVKQHAKECDQKYLDGRRLPEDLPYTRELITRAMNIDSEFERWSSDGGSPVFLNPYFG